jgi:hypothetical protein
MTGVAQDFQLLARRTELHLFFDRVIWHSPRPAAVTTE